MLTIILQGMSSPSSSVSTVSDLSKNIQTVVAVGEDGLIKHRSQLSQLLDLINKEHKISSHPNVAQLSLSFLKLKGFLSEGINVVKGINVSQGNTVVFSLLQGIRTAHGYSRCPKYLGEIRNCFYQGRGVGPHAKQLKKGTQLIVESFIMCCAQIIASRMCCAHSNTDF
jgi:hypothetical protein